MDYPHPVPSLAISVSAILVLSCGQTDTHIGSHRDSDARWERVSLALHKALLASSLYLQLWHHKQVTSQWCKILNFWKSVNLLKFNNVIYFSSRRYDEVSKVIMIVYSINFLLVYPLHVRHTHLFICRNRRTWWFCFSDLSKCLLYRCLTSQIVTKARFPLPELTGRVDGPSWRVMETGHPSTRAVNSGRQLC